MGVTLRLALPAVAALVAATAGCAGPVDMAGSDVLGPAMLEVGLERPTTEGHLAMANLSGQVEAFERGLERVPGEPTLRAALVDLLLTRAAFAGSFDDFARASELADEAVAADPSGPGARALRARVASAVHEFDAALQDGSFAGAAAAGVAATVAVAVGGDLDQALSVREAAVAERATFETLAGLAAVRGALGEFEVADELYRQALTAYGDVSPFPVAWVAFQRGVMWGERAGRPDLARVLYEEAVARLPGYVVANVHLAELEAEAGEVDEAMARLRLLVDGTRDPEPAGLLAELLADIAPEEAAGLAAQARATYDELLVQHPKAFLDHGAEFFMGPGADPERGLELALTNLSHRQDDRAWQVAIEAALVVGDDELAVELAHEAGPGRTSVPLTELQLALQ